MCVEGGPVDTGDVFLGAQIKCLSIVDKRYTGI